MSAGTTLARHTQSLYCGTVDHRVNSHYNMIVAIQGHGHVYLLDGRTPDPAAAFRRKTSCDRSRSTKVHRWPGHTSTTKFDAGGSGPDGQA